MLRFVVLICILSQACNSLAGDHVNLEYRPSPVANPLKGLVPYASDTNVHFPHSMEFTYIGYAELVRGYEKFDWKPLEDHLNAIASRGHQAVFRIYLEYPDKSNILPKFLIDDGLKVHRYLNTNTQPLPPSMVETPDYEDKNLRKSLKLFIEAFGTKYDGDPRIGFITAGLLGTWGEWHTYPREELFASKTVQKEVMDAYEAAFKVTPILLRYPAGTKAWGKAENHKRSFGYHDDSFAWATLDTGKKDDDWFFVPALKQAGNQALEKWKSHPIGGEIRPEAWGKVFDAQPGDPNIQDFRTCVDQTHVSWLMDTGMFAKKATEQRMQRALAEVQHMGYEFHIPSIRVANDKSMLKIELLLHNRGVAPFYYDWQPEYGLIVDGKVVKKFPCKLKLTGLLPGDLRDWKDTIDLSELPKGRYTLALQVANPLPSGLPIRFANATQDHDVNGWLSLHTIDH
jgi:hypothetical protein